MADDLVLNSGSGGATLATDEISSVHHQRVKVQHGADGFATDVSAASPMPTTANAGTNLNTSALALESGGNLDTLAAGVSGSEYQVDVVASLPTGTNSIGAVTANAGTGTFTVDNGGTFQTQATLQSNSGVDIGDVDVLSIAPGTNLLGKISIDQVTANANEVVTKTGSLVQLEAGTAGIGKLTANSGVDIGDVDVTSINAGTNLIGDVGISGARVSGGTTIFRSIDLDEGTLEVVKASAGQIYWMQATNTAATPVFMKIYNATSGTIGTGTPVLTFLIPSQGDSNGAGFVLAIPNGIEFSTGISIGASTGVADSDTGAPATNSCIVNMGFA